MEGMDWYRTIKKPSWAPAETVFGQVWGVLYPIIIAVNIWVVVLFMSGRISWKIAAPFWLNILFNVLFTPIQFGLKSNTLALIDILLVDLTLIWAMVAIWPHQKVITLLFIPYLVWVIIATALQVSITWMNR